jgi:hypothetical protein
MADIGKNTVAMTQSGPRQLVLPLYLGMVRMDDFTPGSFSYNPLYNHSFDP